MLDAISSQAWSEWQAFWHLYGFGEMRMDVRFAQLMALIANLVSDKDSPVTVDDFLPDEGGDDDEEDLDADSDDEAEQDIVDEDQAIFEAMVREMTG